MMKHGASPVRAANVDAQAGHPVPRTRFRRIAAVLATLALGGGLALVGAAAPASAHHTTVTGGFACNTETGLFDLSWSVDNSQSDNRMTITESDRAAVPVGTVVDDDVETFVELGVAPGTYQLNILGEWANGPYDAGSATLVVDGTCERDVPPPLSNRSFTGWRWTRACCIRPPS